MSVLKSVTMLTRTRIICANRRQLSTQLSNVRVRYAPSPTGQMHLGGLRTALFNLFFARRHGGKIIMRIEDTDRIRYDKESESSLESILGWAGIQFDESPLQGGKFGPYIQSQRQHIYKQYASDLLQAGHAYRCYCSPTDLEIQRQIQNDKGRSMYNRKCLDLSEQKKQELLDSNQPHVVRMRVPSGKTIVRDAVYGDVEFDNKTIDDQVLMKADGYPTYHLANVIDDSLMKISHVLRGEEWLASTPKHVILYDMIGQPAPTFAHLPLLLKPDRTKLSKRNKDAFVDYYKEQGYLPAALCHFIAMLGWTPHDEKKELWNIKELSHEFSLRRINRSGAVVDEAKLKYVNRQHMIRVCQESVEESTPEMLFVIDCFRSALQERIKNGSLALYGTDEVLLNQNRLKAIVNLFKDRSSVVTDIPESASYFFTQPTYMGKDVEKWGKKIWKLELVRSLEQRLSLANNEQFSCEETIATIIDKVAKSHDSGKGLVMQTMRYCITGSKMGGSVMQTACVLGKDEVLRRFANAMQYMANKQSEN
eukprot:CFRG3623T1